MHPLSLHVLSLRDDEDTASPLFRAIDLAATRIESAARALAEAATPEERAIHRAAFERALDDGERLTRGTP